MPKRVKTGGQWRPVEKQYIKLGGLYRQLKASYVKVNGVWRETYNIANPVGLILTNVDNLVGSYNLQHSAKGQYMLNVTGYNRDTSRNVILGFRLCDIPATRKVEYGSSAQASSVNATFQVWNNTDLVSSVNGGSGGGSIYYAKDYVDFVYMITANASSGPVTASLVINGLSIEGVVV